MSLDQKFEEAAESVKTITKRPTDAEFLDLYGLFKQSTVGKVNTPKPNSLDLKGKAKWDAWQSRADMSQNDAKEAYIKCANALLEKYK